MMAERMRASRSLAATAAASSCSRWFVMVRVRVRVGVTVRVWVRVGVRVRKRLLEVVRLGPQSDHLVPQRLELPALLGAVPRRAAVR